MNILDSRWPARLAFATALAAGSVGPPALAHGPSQPMALRPVPALLQVRGELPALPGVADLKFRDFFKLPVGPRGLEPTPLLRSLDGQQVRIVGYMVRQGRSNPATGLLVLVPLPVTLDDEDESLADDLPVTAVYVHLADAQRQQRLPHMAGLMALTGRLQLGAQAEPDGRRSMLRLLLDDAVSGVFEPGPAVVHPSFSAFMERLNEPTR
jgi:hypothetical protein